MHILLCHGGDEFTVILPETPYTYAIQVCESINHFCSKSCKEPIPTSISLGCATKESGKQCIYQVLKTAEDRMYRHKLLESKSIRNSILSSLETSLHEKDAIKELKNCGGKQFDPELVSVFISVIEDN